MVSVLTELFVLSVLLTIATSLYAIARVDRPDGRWGATLRRRLILGVPWGTVVTATLILVSYLFIQDGIAQWRNPMTIPFRSWSWFYPTGVLTASFSHGSVSHLTGNLIGTLLFGSLAEYAYGHFPRERGSQSFTGPRRHPYVRAFVIVPGAAIVGGLVVSAFSLGPVIGFSGVVFALAGFALIRYPMTTIILVLGGQSTVSLLYRAIQEPILTRTISPSGPSPPWWAGIAIQGHALGLLLGIVVAAAVFARRKEGPTALRVYLGLVFFGVAQNLWAIYIIESTDTFVLLRAPGVIAVLGLAALIAVAIADTGDGTGDPLRVLEGTGSRWRTAALLGVVVVFAVVAGMALPTKLNTAQADEVPGENPVEIRDYTVTYAEGADYRLVSTVEVPFVELPTSQATASGVIVISERRAVFHPAISKGQLAFSGSRSVDVGGVGWRDSVRAIRRGWEARGGGTAYKVWLQHGEESPALVFTSERATTDSIIAGNNVSVAPASDGFEIVVSRNNSTLGRVVMPEDGGTVTVEGITFERDGRHVFAVVNDTRVKVFSKEQYRQVRSAIEPSLDPVRSSTLRDAGGTTSVGVGAGRHHSMR